MALTTESRTYVGDIGTPLVFEVYDSSGTAVDISAATELVVRVQKPDGTAEEWTAAPGSENHEATYSTLDGDHDQSGPFRYQLYIETEAWQGWSSPIVHMVYDPLPAPSTT